MFKTHKWVRELKGANGFSAVTAYVMTKTEQNDRILMYKGVLEEYYLTAEGRLAYVVLTNCSRFHMHIGDESPATGKHTNLFREDSISQVGRIWHSLMIDGSNIANVLFEKMPTVTFDPEMTKYLETLLKQDADAETSSASANVGLEVRPRE